LICPWANPIIPLGKNIYPLLDKPLSSGGKYNILYGKIIYPLQDKKNYA